MPRYQWIMLLLWLLALALVGWTLTQLPLEAIGQTMQALTWPQWLAWRKRMTTAMPRSTIGHRLVVKT